MDFAKAEQTQLTDGDFQWMSQNFVELTMIDNPKLKNIWFTCKYQKIDAVVKYYSVFEEKSLDSTIEFIQNQIDDWKHQNIVKILDYDFDEKDSYSYRFAICQEKGLFSLRDELDKKNRLDQNGCWNLIGQLAAGLLYAKNNFNIFHGNMKPSNVIKFTEEKNTYKLSEFRSGSAELGKEVKLLAKTQDLTQNEFLAPEYKRIPDKGESADLDPFANDVYALGMVALDALGYKVEYLRGVAPDSRKEKDFFHNVFLELYHALKGSFYCMLETMLYSDPNKRPSIEKIDSVFNCYGSIGELDRDDKYRPEGALLPKEHYKRSELEKKIGGVDYEKLFFISKPQRIEDNKE